MSRGARAKYFSEARNIVTVLSVPSVGLIYTRVSSESLLVLRFFPFFFFCFCFFFQEGHSILTAFTLATKKIASTHEKRQTHSQRLVFSVAVCDTFCTVYRTLQHVDFKTGNPTAKYDIRVSNVTLQAYPGNLWYFCVPFIVVPPFSFSLCTRCARSLFHPFGLATSVKRIRRDAPFAAAHTL